MNNQAAVVTSVVVAIVASVLVFVGLQLRGEVRIGLWAFAIVLIPIATALMAVGVKRANGE